MLPLSSSSTAPAVLAHPSPPPFEVADIVRAYGTAFRATHQVSHEQARVLRAIAQCRTAALGGHVEQCVSCGTERVCYDSCRNRHCPKCQGSARAKWLAAEQALLLPIPYFHVVFTLPHQLNPLIRVNQRLLYDLLFQTAAQTLQEFARAPQHLGADIGITAVLHTWGQTLTEHAHVHCVVTGGGLSADGTQWRACPRRFLFAVKALGQVFRGKYLAGLERLRTQRRLTFAGASAAWAEEAAWNSLRQHLYAKPWVVYAKPPWGSPEQVLKYLSRYTHRVAIANARLIFVGDGVVRFRYTDYAAGGTARVMELTATGVSAPLSPPCRPPRLRPYSALRPARQSLAARKARSRPPPLGDRGRDSSAAPGGSAGLGHSSLTHCCRSLPPLCGHPLV